MSVESLHRKLNAVIEVDTATATALEQIVAYCAENRQALGKHAYAIADIIDALFNLRAQIIGDAMKEGSE